MESGLTRSVAPGIPNHHHRLLLTADSQHHSSTSRDHPEQALLLTYHQKAKSSLTLRHFLITHHHKVSQVRDILGGREHIHITLISGYCYNCPISLSLLLISYWPNLEIKRYHRYVCMYSEVTQSCPNVKT